MEPTVHKHDLESIVEKSIDGLLVVDSSGLIRFANPSAAKILNTPAEKLIGQTFEHPLKEGRIAEMAIVREDGKSGNGEYRIARTSWNGETAYVVTIRDITERVVYDRLKDEWIQNVSHELRTPLTSIRESLALIHDGVFGPVNEEQKGFLAMSLKNADHLRRILNNLLDLSKIEAGKVKLNKKRSNLVEIVRSAVDSFIPMVQTKGLDLRVFLPSEAVDVYIDKDSIVQVLNNLVGNAVKFTETGAVEITVRDLSNRAECVIADTGHGIAEEHLPKVFDRFQQFGKAPGPGNVGTGLGLSIAKEIVILHDGSIGVKSELNRGSTFTFSLPKYSLDLEAEDQIQGHLASAKEPFLLFSILLHPTDGLDAEAMACLVRRTSQKLRQAFGAEGKHVVPIQTESQGLVILIEKTSAHDAKTRRDILRTVKEAFFESGIESEVDFSYGIGAYPTDGESPGPLLLACRSGRTRERDERLNKSIWLVDDEKELTDATKILLDLFGYRNVSTANRGEDIFERLPRGLPDLIILDMKMPGMSGYEVIGRLKENFNTKDIPIVIMSGYEVETRQFNDYINRKAILTINKPADPDLLRKTIYYLL